MLHVYDFLIILNINNNIFKSNKTDIRYDAKF